MNQIRTVNIPGSVPTTNQLALGDIAINTVDGKAYLKKYSGSIQTVLEIGAGAVAVSASYALSSSYAATASIATTALDILVYCKNQSGYTITKGMVVRITGSNNSSDIPRVVSASYDSDRFSANTLGIANENITNGNDGYVMTEGVLLGIDTNAYTSGQLIYLGPTGSIVGTPPLAPLHTVRLGEVIRHQSNNGSIYIRIDNGYELGELHDVLDTTTTSSYGDLLVKSGSVWTNSKSLTGSYSITGSLTISGSSTFTNIGPAIFSGSILSTTGFTGSIQGTSSYALNAVSSSQAVSSSFARTASAVTVLNQAVTIGNITSTPASENTLNIYPPFAGGTGEGGQILLAASGGLYSSASMIDTWQDQFRILRGSNTGGSNAGLLYMNLQTGDTQFTGAVTASAFSGLPNSYLYVSRTTNQTIPSGNWANRDILFNTTVSGNGISYDSGTGLASLTGGKVYRITARLAWASLAVYLLQFSCYDSSDVQLGPTVEIVQASNTSNNISDGTLDFIYAPASNTSIKIRTTANTTALSGEYIRGDLNTQLIIQQIA